MDPFPFVVGVERSGTTLVRAVLDAHPEMAVPQESYFVAELAVDRGRYERPDGLDTDALARHIANHPRFRRWGLPHQDVRTVVSGCASYADAIRAVYAQWARREGKTRYADKTPQHLLAMPLLAEVFPEARFVHVVRDGRDVALSFAEEFDLPVSRVIRRWRAWVTLARSQRDQLGSDRYLELRYERLVTETEAVVRELCDFIALPFDAAMLRHEERAARVLAPMPDRRHHQHIALAVTPGLRDWRTQMSPDDIGLCERRAGALLEELGYETSGARPSLRARAHSFGRDLAARVRG